MNKVRDAATGMPRGKVEAAATGKPASAFDKIAAGLTDAIAYAEGDTSRAREATVDVKAVRQITRKTQAAFARAYRFPIGTVRDWEQGRRQPDAGSATLLKMIAAEPDTVARLISQVD